MSKVNWEAITGGERAEEGAELPSISIVIPSYNCSQKIAWSLDSLQGQSYPNLEVIVVDGGSTDRTLEEVRRRRLQALRVYSVAEYNRSEMYNRGISVASGDYITLLSPGDTYLYEGALDQVVNLMEAKGRPDLVYCGVLRRDYTGSIRTVLRDLSYEHLSRGRVPSSLGASFFRLDTIRQLGKLDASIRLRGGFDLVCRFYHRKNLVAQPCERVLVEHDPRILTARATLRRFWETQKVIGRHFGTRAALRFWLGQNHWELIRLWWKSKRFHVWT
ncbi:MAG: glycosyltransferase [Parachlamydiales bacterium]